jgi:DDE superfamily endonuclease
MYNWDEKGFLLGMAHALKRIMTLDAVKTGRIMGASQDGSREFLSLLACICADGTKLPPALVYRGESHDMLDSWVQDFNEGDQAYFASTKNGWSCDELGLQWLQKVFHPHTKDKAGNRRRLLIVDGHSSHVNMKFIDWADRHRIIIMILPPHSTHRLQPLDVGLFSPLATAYSNEITQLMNNGFGYVSISKREFWPMFKTS